MSIQHEREGGREGREEREKGMGKGRERGGEDRCVEGLALGRRLQVDSLPLLPPSSYAFGLEETNYRARAEQLVREVLARERRAPFATHVMCELAQPSGREGWSGAVSVPRHSPVSGVT